LGTPGSSSFFFSPKKPLKDQNKPQKLGEEKKNHATKRTSTCVIHDSNSCSPVDNIIPLQSPGYNSDTEFQAAEEWCLKILEKSYV